MTQGTLRAFAHLLRRYARPYAGVIAFMVAVTLAANALTLAQPAIVAALLANLSGSAQQPIPPQASWLDLNYLGTRVSGWIAGAGAADVLVTFGLLYLGISVAVAALNYGAESLATWLKARTGQAIQLDLVDHLLRQDMLFFARRKSGELVSRATFDVNATAQGLGPVIRGAIHQSVQVVVYGAYLASTSVWLTVGAGVLLTAQFGLTQLLRRPTRRLVSQEADAAAGFLSTLQEVLSGIRVAKSFGAEAFELARVREAAAAQLDSAWRKGRLEKLEAPLRSVLDAAAVLGIFLIAIAQMRSGRLTFEGLILFTYVGRQLITPINSLATLALWVESVTAASGRITALMEERPAISDGPVAKSTFETALSLRSVAFSYRDQPAIDHLSLDIRKGEFIALVGPSGAGKSTLADLILRLYDPDDGVVEIDGVDLRQLRQREYRGLFGVVSQETLLFHDTIRRNIRYGRDTVSDDMIVDAARLANAHQFISALPQGYDTVVGDRGLRLSGGERQRLAIARAIVHNPQLLVLDEATSALDSESERLVQDALARIMARTTTIAIAHRLSTVLHADRIVVLDRGRIEAIGRHEALLESSETYSRFCRLQFVPRPEPSATAS